MDKKEQLAALSDRMIEAMRGAIDRSIKANNKAQEEKFAPTIDTFERRLSRQASHLAALESRLQKLEHK